MKGRRESRSSSTSTTTTLTSAPRQEPDGAPASSPRKTSDDYSGSSAASSRKNSEDLKANPREEFRAEIIAASRKRSGDTRLGGVVGGGRESPSRPKHSGGGRKSVYNHLNEVAERESQRYKYYHPQEEGLQQHHGRHHHREGSRRSQSPESRRLTQELPEFHQERREYREYRGSSRHSHSPPGRIPSSKYSVRIQIIVSVSQPSALQTWTQSEFAFMYSLYAGYSCLHLVLSVENA